MSKISRTLPSLFRTTAFYVATISLGIGIALVSWAGLLFIAPVPTPLSYQITVPPRISIEINHQITIRDDRMPILIKVDYNDILSGQYNNYPGIVGYTTSRTLVYWLNAGSGQFIEAEETFSGFEGNAFYARVQYADGVLTFDPARDYFLIAVLFVAGLVSLFVSVIAAGILWDEYGGDYFRRAS